MCKKCAALTEDPDMKLVAAYFATLAVFVVVDFIWLGFVARDFYRSSIGHLMSDNFNIPAAIVFYLIYPIGVVMFAVSPGLDAGNLAKAAILGLAFGFFAYATYDLTNLATLRDWPIGITIADIAWGSILTATAATAGFAIASRV